MKKFDRREFIKIGSIAPAGLLVGENSFSGYLKKDQTEILKKMQKRVKFTRDGIDMTPLEYSDLLLKLSKQGEIEADNYSIGGAVARLEKRFSEILGKEAGIFMPTGTLANHIAVRKLAGNRDRVIVPSESHLYNDSGDCAQKLSGLNLVPLGKGEPGFTLNEVKNAIKRSDRGRVKTGVGCIVIESPVRRKDNRIFNFKEMSKISEFARKNGISMHLDGARLFNASVHMGVPLKDIAKLFDTVYISLYKDFNTPSGAVLLGSREFISGLYHERRMFGGGMPQVWPFTSVALHYVDSFIEDYKKALKRFNLFKASLEKSGKFKVKVFPDGTNVFLLKIQKRGIDLDRFRKELSKRNIEIPKPDKEPGLFKMKINVTLNRESHETVAEKFIASLK